MHSEENKAKAKNKQFHDFLSQKHREKYFNDCRSTYCEGEGLALNVFTLIQESLSESHFIKAFGQDSVKGNLQIAWDIFQKKVLYDITPKLKIMKTIKKFIKEMRKNQNIADQSQFQNLCQSFLKLQNYAIDFFEHLFKQARNRFHQCFSNEKNYLQKLETIFNRKAKDSQKIEAITQIKLFMDQKRDQLNYQQFSLYSQIQNMENLSKLIFSYELLRDRLEAAQLQRDYLTEEKFKKIFSNDNVNIGSFYMFTFGDFDSAQKQYAMNQLFDFMEEKAKIQDDPQFVQLHQVIKRLYEFQKFIWLKPDSNVDKKHRQTAGSKLKNDQQQIIKTKIFQEIFPDKMMKDYELYKYEEIFQTNSDIDTDTKRKAMINLVKFMNNMAKPYFGNQKFAQFSTQIYDLSKCQDQMHLNRMYANAQQYFNEWFPAKKGWKVKIGKKRNGDHLGCTMQFLPPKNSNQKSAFFYIKTHSEGIISNNSSAARRLNFIEPFVYKILEEIGIGCEFHFFVRDEYHCYIATKGAESEGEFLTYEQLKLNKKLDKDFFISEEFYMGIFCLDLISRIMSLDDFQTNNGNFGFVNILQQNKWKVRAFDFTITEKQKKSDYLITQSHFRGYLVGNKSVSYTEDFINVAFSSQKERLKSIAKTIFQSQLQDFAQKVDRAYKATEQLLTKNFPKYTLDKDSKYFIACTEIYTSLDLYKNAIKQNWNIFDRAIKKDDPVNTNTQQH